MDVRVCLYSDSRDTDAQRCELMAVGLPMRAPQENDMSCWWMVSSMLKFTSQGERGHGAHATLLMYMHACMRM